MKQITVNYNGDDEITVTVQAATALMGMKRSRLIGEALRQADDDPDVRLWQLEFPSYLVATVAVEGMEWPVSFEQFLELPEALVGKWERAIYECNPHWRGLDEDEAEVKKKSPKDSTKG